MGSLSTGRERTRTDASASVRTNMANRTRTHRTGPLGGPSAFVRSFYAESGIQEGLVFSLPFTGSICAPTPARHGQVVHES